MDEKLPRGLTKSREASAKWKAIRQEEELSVRGIIDQMQEYCDELDVRFHDVWTAKEFGCARNWLSYCRKAQVDPRKRLYEVCRFWPYFKRGALFRDTGKRIVLPDTVSFSKYFCYRREIESWIIINRDKPARFVFDEVQIVDVEAWSRGEKGGAK